MDQEKTTSVNLDDLHLTLVGVTDQELNRHQELLSQETEPVSEQRNLQLLNQALKESTTSL